MTVGSGGSHSVGKSGRNYFGTHIEKLYEQNEASARGKYMGDLLEREQDNHTEIEVVRLNTHPTPGGPGSEECPTTLVTIETSAGGLGASPTPGDTSLETRPATPPTPGTPVVQDPVESFPGSSNNLSLQPTPGGGQGGDSCERPFLSPSLSPAYEGDSPRTPEHPVTQVDWVALSVVELEASDPEMAVFVAECDEREAQVPTAPANQGQTTRGAGGGTTQSKGIKKTFACLWLPVYVCVPSRVHSLLSGCPPYTRINGSVQTVTVVPSTETNPMVCSLTLGGLSLVNHR